MWWSCLVCKVPGSLAQHKLWGEVGGCLIYNLVRYQGVWRSTCCGGRSVDVSYIGWGRGVMKCLWFFVILCILCFLFSFQCHLAFCITCFYFQRLVSNSGENSLHGSWKCSARHFLLSLLKTWIRNSCSLLFCFFLRYSPCHNLSAEKE